MSVPNQYGPVASMLVGILCLVAAGAHAGPASAQVDLSGNWRAISAGGGGQDFPVDFAGVPVNTQGRAAALSYNAERLEELQQQCQPYLAHYLVTTPVGGIDFEPIRDPVSGTVIAWQIGGTVDRPPMTIWMDGRRDPPLAEHTSSGFSTGTWQGDTLIVTTTHLNDGLLTHNGVPSSNQTTLTLFFTRHGDLLSATGVIRDPVYLEAPWVVAQVFRTDTNGPAFESDVILGHCMPENVISGLSDGYHSISYLPGQNPDLRYMWDHYGIPPDAALGGVHTMLPQSTHELERQYRRPRAYCAMACCDSRDPKMDCKSLDVGGG